MEMDPRGVKFTAGPTFGRTRWPEDDGWGIIKIVMAGLVPAIHA
jgi:hypothetical protein